MDSEDTVSPWLSHAAPTHSRRSIHACPHAPALRFDYPPPTIRFLARPPCPSCSVPSIASLCSALSRTTRDHSKAKGPDGDSLVICRCVQGTLFCSPSPCRMSNASKRLTRIIHEGFYCNRRYEIRTYFGILSSRQDHTKGARPRKRGGDAPGRRAGSRSLGQHTAGDWRPSSWRLSPFRSGRGTATNPRE